MALGLLLGACAGGGGKELGAGPTTASTARQRAACTPTVEVGSQVEIRPRWTAGDSRSFRITKTREDSESASMADMNGTAEVDVHVLETGPSSSRLRWESGNSIVNAAALQLGPAYQEALEDFGEFRFAVDYSTDEWGGFDRVENLDDLRSQAEAMMAKLAGALGDSPEVTQAIDLARQLILSDTFLQTALVEDIIAFHVAYGLVVPPHDTVTLDQDFPNPYGGPPIPGTATSKLLSTGDADGCVVVELVSVPDAEAFTRAFAEMFSQTAGSRFSLPEGLGKFEVRNTMRLAYDPGSGWIVRADLEKNIHLDGTSRSYHTLIEAT